MSRIDDSSHTWAEVYKTLGEEGLLEFSKEHHNPARCIGKTVEEAFMFRLAAAASKLPLSHDEFYRIASKLPEDLRPFLVDNKDCPESLIEDLWVGNYFNAAGVSRPSQVITYAFYNNHYKMISIYARRPDLRAHVSEYMRRMTESSLKDQRQALLKAN